MLSGPASSPIFLLQELPDARGSTPCARSSTPSSSTWCVAAVPGVCSRTTSHRGRLSTITSERGVSTALGSGCTRPCGEEPEYVWGETHNLRGRHHRFTERQDHRGRR